MLPVLVTLAGIVLPSFLLVLCVRRWLAPVPFSIALLFLALTLGFLHGAVFTSKLPVPVDEVARGWPYRALFGDVAAKNPLTNDTVKLFLPWMQVAREELSHGRAPLWNRYSFSGYPLLGNGESAPFSPFFLITLFVPLPKQIVAMAGLKLFVSLLFGYLFLRREQLSHAAACFGAIVFAFSTFETVYLYYSTTAVTALFPATLFALFHALETRSRGAVTFVVLIVATLLANGHPESVLHIAIAAGVLMGIDLALATDRRDWLLRFRRPLAGALAGAALATPAWLPTLDQIRLSTRLADLQTAARVPPLPYAALWTIVAPNGFGNPARHNWNWIANYSVVATTFIGLITLAVLLAAAVSRRAGARERLWLAAAVVFYLTAMEWTPLGLALNAVPPLSISANEKLRFVVCFLAACVAAKWLDRSAQEPRIPFVVSAVLIAGAAIYVWRAKPFLTLVDLLGVLALGSLLLVMMLAPRQAVVVAGVAAVLELFACNASFNALTEARFFRPELPILRALKAHAADLAGAPYRVAGLDWMFLPNGSSQYGLEDVRGSDPMSYRAYTDYLRRIGTRDASGDLERVVRVDTSELDLLNCRYLLTEPGAGAVGEKWRLLYAGADGKLFENSGVRPRFFSREANVDIEEVSGSHFRLRVHAERPAFIESSEPAPGWRVLARARKVKAEEIEGAFLAFHLSAGETVVDVEYHPRAFFEALPIALLVFVGLLFWTFSDFPKPWNRTLHRQVVPGP